MVSGFPFTESHETPTPRMLGHKMLLPVSFYTACLISNVLLIILYTVQMYKSHKSCIVDGNDITENFDLAFRLGFAILIADFFNLNIVSLTIPQNGKDQFSNSGFNEDQKRSLLTSVVLDWFIKVLTVIVSCLQYLILSSKQS